MNAATKKYAGPVLRQGEIADAVIDAIREDNPGKEILIVEHTSYLRVRVEQECVIHRATIERMLGRPFQMRELEVNMPGFAGFIRTSTDSVRFVLNSAPAAA